MIEALYPRQYQKDKIIRRSPLRNNNPIHKVLIVASGNTCLTSHSNGYLSTDSSLGIIFLTNKVNFMKTQNKDPDRIRFDLGKVNNLPRGYPLDNPRYMGSFYRLAVINRNKIHSIHIFDMDSNKTVKFGNDICAADQYMATQFYNRLNEDLRINYEQKEKPSDTPGFQ